MKVGWTAREPLYDQCPWADSGPEPCRRVMMRRFLWKASHCSRVRVPLLLAVGAGLLAAPTAASGFGDVAGFTAFFNATDKNGDGVLCIKAPPEGNNPSVPGIWQYQYSFVD